MKRLTAAICLTLALLLGSACMSFALPACPSDESKPYDNCFGTYTYDNGNKYVGEWKAGGRYGQGTFTWANGNKYVGEWKDGKYNGQGTLTYANGDKYVGEWKDDKHHGQGTFTWANGFRTGELSWLMDATLSLFPEFAQR